MRRNPGLVHIAELLPDVVAAQLGQADPTRCPVCGAEHPTVPAVPHLCGPCQRAETRARHERIVAELRTVRAGGRRKKGSSDAS